MASEDAPLVRGAAGNGGDVATAVLLMFMGSPGAVALAGSGAFGSDRGRDRRIPISSGTPS